MNFAPTKFNYLIVFLCTLIFSLSCSKDSDILSDAALNDDSKEVDNFDPEADDGLVNRTVEFLAVNDAYIQNNSGFDEPIIRLEENSRTSYLMFDLSEIEGDIVSASLELIVNSDEGHGSIYVSKGVSSNWSEEDLNASTAPLEDIQLGGLNESYLLGEKETVILSASDIQPEKTSIILRHEAGNDLAFASKEHPVVDGPKLRVTYRTSPDSPLPNTSGSEEETENTEDPPAEDPPAEDPPAEDPPVEDPPAEDPPAQDPPNNQDVDYYVTPNGSYTNDGRSEADAWNLERAFNSAVAGDVVMIKAGDYGSVELVADNSGTAGNPIKFIGYTNSPWDLTTTEGSSFSRGDSPDSGRMPLFRSNQPAQGTAIAVYENYIHLENFQLVDYGTGIFSSGTNGVFRNIVAIDMGTQGIYDAYDGFGMHIKGNNSLVENSYVENATAEGIKFNDADYSTIKNCSVYALNAANPTDYYFILSGGTNNATIENCLAERMEGLAHGGHGFNMKDLAENNLVTKCTAIGTSIDLNFSGVRYNTIKDSFIYGVSTDASQWHARIIIANGANNNYFDNIYIQDTWTAIFLADYEDGFVGQGGDRDEVSCGYDNTFENIDVVNTNSVIRVGGGNEFTAAAERYTFKNSTFTGFRTVAVTYYPTEDIVFENCTYNDGELLYVEAGGVYEPYSTFDVSFVGGEWNNVNFAPPN